MHPTQTFDVSYIRLFKLVANTRYGEGLEAIVYTIKVSVITVGILHR